VSGKQKRRGKGTLGRVPSVVVGGDDSDRDQSAEIDAENAATWRAIEAFRARRAKEGWTPGSASP
jgi:hypothetical protein